MPKGFGYGPDAGKKKKDEAAKAGATSYSQASRLMNLAAETELTRKATKGLAKNMVGRVKEMGGPQMGHSPAEMGHSPAEMGHSPAQMQGNWISKHAQHSRLGSNPDIKYGGDVIDETAQKSAMKMGHSPAQKKMPMVKGPDGKMVPEFAVDKKGKS